MKFRILHFSDTHAPAVFEHGRTLFDKRLLGWINSSLIRKGRYDQSILPTMIAYILQNPPDLAIFTGDATSSGQPGEFARVLPVFEPLLKSYIPFLYVPGNHDAYVKDPVCTAALERFTLQMSRGDRSLADYPFTVELPYLRISVLHCARPVNCFMSSGFMDPFTRKFVLDAAAGKDARPLITVGHFPLLIQSSILNFRRRLYGAADTAALLRKGIIDLSLCGHIHHPCEILDAAGRGEIVAGSLTKYGVFAEITYDTETRCFSLQRRFLNK